MKRIELFVLISCVAFFACNGNSKKDKPVVTVTTNMIADIVKHVAGDSVELQVLMGPGVDPHLYKAGQGDLQKLSEADMIFYNGLHLEGKMVEIFEKLSHDKPTYPVADALPGSSLMYPANTSAADPHIWFDASLWKLCVSLVAEKLCELDSANAKFYRDNGDRYIKELDSLHEEIKRTIAVIPESRRILITSHDAFGYYGRAYGVQVKGIQGISTMAEPGLKDMADLFEFVKTHDVHTVFVESSVNPKLVQSLVDRAEENDYVLKIGGQLYSDAMGADDTPEGTYPGMLRYNTREIVNALQ